MRPVVVNQLGNQEGVIVAMVTKLGFVTLVRLPLHHSFEEGQIEATPTSQLGGQNWSELVRIPSQYYLHNRQE